MQVSVPALRGQMGSRTYYACLMALDAVPTLFKFTDWYGILPEDREQRVLNEKRIPDLKNYILDNEDDYLFASITASYKPEPSFEPFQNGPDGAIGMLKLRLGDELIINDGQHRAAGIAAAIRENPKLGGHSISVLLFPWETKERVQQMFSDLNRYVQKTSKSLEILFDQRDEYATATRAFMDRVPLFKELTEMEDVSLKSRSTKIFTLAALYDANSELLKRHDQGDLAAHVDVLTEFWGEVSKHMSDWKRVLNGTKSAIEFRAKFLSAHSTALRALGGIGGEIMKSEGWQARLAALARIDWSKQNPEWDNICMVGNSVTSNRQARVATKAFIKSKLELELSDSERKILNIAREPSGPNYETYRTAKADVAHSGGRESPVFVTSNSRVPDLRARGKLLPNGKMLVLEGSTAKAHVEASLSQGDRDFRNFLIKVGTLTEKNKNLLLFTKDVEFESSSSAISTIHTCSRSGPRDWVLESHSSISLGDWEASQSRSVV